LREFWTSFVLLELVTGEGWYPDRIEFCADWRNRANSDQLAESFKFMRKVREGS